MLPVLLLSTYSFSVSALRGDPARHSRDGGGLAALPPAVEDEQLQSPLSHPTSMSELKQFMRVESATQVNSRVAVHLMDAAVNFLNNHVSTREKARLRKYPFVEVLERRGFPLEKQLSAFAISETAAYVNNEPEAVHEQTKKGLDALAELHSMAVRARDSSNKHVRRDVDHGDAHSALLQQNEDEMECLRGTDFSPDDYALIANKDDANYGAKGFIRFCGEESEARKICLVQQGSVLGCYAAGDLEKARDLSPPPENSSEYFSAWAEDVTADPTMASVANFTWFTRLRDAATPHVGKKVLSSYNKEEYRAWKRAQAHRFGNWFRDREPDPDDEEAVTIKKYQDLLAEIATVSSKIAGINGFALHAAKTDWASLKYTTRWDRFVSGLKAVGASIWNAFKSMIQIFTRKCAKDSEKVDVSKQEKADLDKLKDLAAGTGQQAELEKELDKANAAMDKVEAKETESGEQIDKAFESLQEKKEKAVEGNLTQQDVKEVATDMAQLRNQTCDNIHSKIAGTLKEFGKTLKTLLQQGMSAGWDLVKPPHLGIRGAGGFEEDGGYEEVIDFRNREIGYFQWGGEQMGTGSFSKGLGGYTGISWKGYKEEWDLQEAYQTLTYGVMGVGIPLPLSLDVGVTVGSDADNSKYPLPSQGLWTLDTAGIVGYTIGASFSAGINLPIDLDFGQAAYSYLTSECFDSTASMLARMVLPFCTSCAKPWESGMIADVRMMARVNVLFLGTTEILFSILALMNDFKYHGHNRSVCSTGSTRNRYNLDSLRQTVAQKLEEAQRHTDQTISLLEGVFRRMAYAIERDPDLIHVAELEQIVIGFTTICPRKPAKPSNHITTVSNPFGTCSKFHWCSPGMKCQDGHCICEVGYCYDVARPVVGVLTAKVVKASIESTEPVPPKDPNLYVVIYVGDAVSQQTSTVQNNHTAEWTDDSHNFTVFEGAQMVEFSLVNHGSIFGSSDEYLGTASVPLPQLDGTEIEFEITPRDGACRVLNCSLTVKLAYAPPPPGEGDNSTKLGGSCQPYDWKKIAMTETQKAFRARRAVRRMSNDLRLVVRQQQMRLGHLAAVAAGKAESIEELDDTEIREKDQLVTRIRLLMGRAVKVAEKHHNVNKAKPK